MTTNVITIPPTTTLTDAHQLMIKEEIRRLPVVEPQGEDEPGRLVGIITLGDIRGAEPSMIRSIGVWEMTYLLATATVDKFMTPDPVTITPDATLANAALIMLSNRIGTLPVVDQNGRLVGILTESDIFSMLVIQKWGYLPQEEDAVTNFSVQVSLDT